MDLGQLQGKVDQFLIDSLRRQSSSLTRRSIVPRITWNRFDLGFKLFYLDKPDARPDAFAARLYDTHILALSLGLANEPGNDAKVGLDRFRADFREILESLRANGFDPAKSLVPLARDGTPLNGAHRVSAAMALGVPIDVVDTPLEPMIFDQRFFRDRGVPEIFMQAAALRAVEASPGAQVILREKHSGRNDRRPFYSGGLRLSERGLRNLEVQIDGADAVFTTWPKSGEFWLEIFLSQDNAPQTPSGEGVLGRSRTHRGALDVSRLLLNRNSRHHLETAAIRPEAQVWQIAQRIRSSTNQPLALDMDLVLAAYNIRDPRRATYCAEQPVPGLETAQHCRNLHSIPDDEILSDPRNHFFAFGSKFVSLRLVAETLRRMGETSDAAFVQDLCEPAPKDLIDLPRGRLLYHRLRRSVIALLFRLGIGRHLRSIYRALLR